MTPLSVRENFYVIVGSSAGALIGLQFVVLTLIASRPVGAGTAQAGHAFATPTIVHFGSVLLLAGILSAPWQEITPGAVLWGLLGLSGILYASVVIRRMRRQATYKPVFEDWLFHVLLPLAAYTTLAVTTLAAGSHLRRALFGIGAAALLLLFIGIHNAWDAVTYHVFDKPKTQTELTTTVTKEHKGWQAGGAFLRAFDPGHFKDALAIQKLKVPSACSRA
jgi:hypothetical protein